MLTFVPDGYYVCLSSDDKPIENVKNGQILVEMDKAKIYFFDKEGGQWRLFEE